VHLVHRLTCFTRCALHAGIAIKVYVHLLYAQLAKTLHLRELSLVNSA